MFFIIALYMPIAYITKFAAQLKNMFYQTMNYEKSY
jgi:hypothetical protein